MVMMLVMVMIMVIAASSSFDIKVALLLVTMNGGPRQKMAKLLKTNKSRLLKIL